jgi:hypothetical protein
MSRYFEIKLQASPITRNDLEALFQLLNLSSEWAQSSEQVLLSGSLECAGEPVDVRIAAGALGSIQDFGFRQNGHAYELVCGEFDRTTLATTLRAALDRVFAQATVEASLRNTAFRSEKVELENGETRYIVVRNE